MIGKMVTAAAAAFVFSLAPVSAEGPKEKRDAYADSAREFVESRLETTTGCRIVVKGEVYDVVAVGRDGRSAEAEALTVRVTARTNGARISFYDTVVFIDGEPVALEGDLLRIVEA